MTSARTAVAFILFLVAPAIAQGTGSIKGTVTGADGDALYGANVIVQGASLDGPVKVVSDENGMYAVADLPDGVYDVSVSFVGYETVSRSNVRISDGGEVNLDFTLDVEVLYGEQIVVSASRRREKVLDAPASVGVVESEAVEAQRGLRRRGLRRGACGRGQRPDRPVPGQHRGARLQQRLLRSAAYAGGQPDYAGAFTPVQRPSLHSRYEPRRRPRRGRPWDRDRHFTDRTAQTA